MSELLGCWSCACLVKEISVMKSERHICYASFHTCSPEYVCPSCPDCTISETLSTHSFTRYIQHLEGNCTGKPIRTSHRLVTRDQVCVLEMPRVPVHTYSSPVLSPEMLRTRGGYSQNISACIFAVKEQSETYNKQFAETESSRLSSFKGFLS